jgi:hypothetical protein
MIASNHTPCGGGTANVTRPVGVIDENCGPTWRVEYPL